MKRTSPQPPAARLSVAAPSIAALSVAGRIAEVLAGRIVRGDMQPGRKVGQDAVAAEFGASHVPVREAFRRLEARGLLVGEPRRGVRVAPIDPASIMEVTEMRAALETLALRRAAPAITPADVTAARRAIDEGEASADPLVWEETNRRFHRALIAPCGMARLLGVIDDLHAASARYRHVTWRDLDWRSRSDAEHRAILVRMAAGDAEAAATLLGAHILDAGRALAAR